MEHHAVTDQREQRLALGCVCLLDLEAEGLVDGVDLLGRERPTLRLPSSLVALGRDAVLFVDEDARADLEALEDLVRPIGLKDEVLERAPRAAVAGHCRRRQSVRGRELAAFVQEGGDVLLLQLPGGEPART